VNDNYYIMRSPPLGSFGPLPGPSWVWGAAAGAAVFFLALKKRRRQ
jgi:hypothetical protein